VIRHFFCKVKLVPKLAIAVPIFVASEVNVEIEWNKRRSPAPRFPAAVDVLVRPPETSLTPGFIRLAMALKALGRILWGSGAPTRSDGGIAAAPLLADQVEEQFYSILLSLEEMSLNLAFRSDTTPPPRHASPNSVGSIDIA
jgi:hypothetical protein